MSIKKRKLQISDTVLIFIILILIVISLTLYVKKILIPKKQEQQAQNSTQQTTVVSESKQNNQTVEVPKTNEEIIKKLSTLGERDRMEYYCGVYFKHIEKKEYNEAYKLLYSEFKEKYFPTIEEYEEYIEKTYPKNWALEYDDITRQGSIYVLRLKILDILGSKDDEKIQRIVVKENNYNDFVISFQVI